MKFLGPPQRFHYTYCAYVESPVLTRYILVYFQDFYMIILRFCSCVMSCLCFVNLYQNCYQVPPLNRDVCFQSIMCHIKIKQTVIEQTFLYLELQFAKRTVVFVGIILTFEWFQFICSYVRSNFSFKYCMQFWFNLFNYTRQKK